MALDVQFAIRCFLCFTGVFEFMMTYKLWTCPKEEMQKKIPLYPAAYFDAPVKYLLMIFTLFLGLLRFMWSVSASSSSVVDVAQRQTDWSALALWLSVVATQVAECVFFFTLLQLPSFNVKGEAFFAIYARVLRGNDREARFLLTAIPLITLLVIIHGP